MPSRCGGPGYVQFRLRIGIRGLRSEMGRQRVDAALAALARSRSDLSSAHFGLSFRLRTDDPLAPQPRIPGRLAISAPKRQLRHAVDRNALKRVAREAWRLTVWPESGRPSVAMLKLRRTDADWKTAGRATLKRRWRAEIDDLLRRLIRRLTDRSVAGQAGAPALPSDRSGSQA